MPVLLVLRVRWVEKAQAKKCPSLVGRFRKDIIGLVAFAVEVTGGRQITRTTHSSQGFSRERGEFRMGRTWAGSQHCLHGAGRWPFPLLSIAAPARVQLPPSFLDSK